MSYLRTKKMKLTILTISLFILFHVGKFIKTRIISIGLPKGKIVLSATLHGDNEVYAMNLNGTNLKRLTRYSFFGPTHETWIADFRPSFSPDGNRIIFDSNRDDKRPSREFIYDSQGRVIGDRGVFNFSEIYIIDINGKSLIRLTYNQIENNSPIFSPDGKKILFCSVPSTDNPFYEELRIINTDGIDERILISGDRIARLAKFSPDSQRVFFVLRGDLYAIDINEDSLARLTYFNPQDIEKPDDVEGIPFIDNFAVSPDGKEITLVTRERKVLQFIFYSMNADGSGMKDIVRLNNPDQRGYIGRVSEIKYSPNGQNIVFIGDFFLDKNFYLLDLDNNNLTLIIKFNFKKTDVDGNHFFISPNGNQVLFVASFPYGLFDDWFAWFNSVIHEMYFNLKYYIFKRLSSVYDNKYLCIMDIETGNFRQITRLPFGTQFGRDFIHWEE